MPTGFAINNVDLENIGEVSRDTSTDDTLSFNATIFKQKAGSIPLTSLIGATRPYQKSQSLFPMFAYYTQEPPFLEPMCKKGYRPRFINHVWRIERNGSTTRRLYFVFRTESALYVMGKNSGEAYFSVEATYGPSYFPYGVVPHVLFYELFGAGGGGAGGVGVGHPSLVYGNGGGGGGGGAICWGWIPVNTYSSPVNNPNIEIDFIFDIFRGGYGGNWGGVYNAGSGEAGYASTLRINNADIIIVGGGNGGTHSNAGGAGGAGGGISMNYAFMKFEGDSATTYIHGSHFAFHTFGGQVGGNSHSNGWGWNSDILLEQERFVASSNGGVAYGNKINWLGIQVRQAGGGGGAGRYDGGRGMDNGGQGLGGGGGGGTGGIGEAGSGKSGGNGGLRLFF